MTTTPSAQPPEPSASSASTVSACPSPSVPPTASLPGGETPGGQYGIPLPGGTSISHVRVYDTVGPDGLAGGSPHLHTACTEAYLVIAGEGSVQTLSGEGFDETPLSPGSVAWFAPGTVHRLVNHSGDLELYVLMSNAGLPEAGDLVLAFEPELLADADRCRAAALLPPDGSVSDGDPTAAMARRDLAVRGFTGWRRRVEQHGPEALDELYAAAVELVGSAARHWGSLLAADPAVDLARSSAQVAALAGDEPGQNAEAVTRLGQSGIRHRRLLPETRRMGCCGTLGTVVH